MKKFSIQLILTIFFLPAALFGENDTVISRIGDHKDTKSEIILKGRRKILDKFIEGNYTAVSELVHHLKYEVEDENYAVFYPAEYWFLLYWTRDYNELISSITSFDSLEVAILNRKIKPFDEIFYEKILERSRMSLKSLELFVRNSDLSPMDKDFLSMNLNYLVSGRGYKAVTQDTLNKLADAFLIKYSHSNYEKFTRKIIRKKYVPANWGLTVEFFTGYGILTGNLRKNYQNNIPIGVAFDIYYRKFCLLLRDYIGFSNTRQDILYNDGTWGKGSQVRVYIPEASLGFVLLDNKYLKLMPFAGIASTDIGPTSQDEKDNPDLRKVDLEFTTTYTVGFSIDLKFGNHKKSMVTYIPESSYGFLRFRYTYAMPQFFRRYEGYNGNMHTFTIGIGIFERNIKRIY